MKEKLLLGAARRNITPPIGCCLAGYAPDVIAKAVNDDLTVTAFAFEQDGKRALLASCTLLSLATSISNELRASIEEKFGIPKESVILHTIHNHSGPNTNISYGWGDANREYLNTIFIPRLMEAIEEAAANMKSVTMAVTVGESLVGVNRRERTKDNTVRLGQNPWGCFDPQMTVISFVGFVSNLLGSVFMGIAKPMPSIPTPEYFALTIPTTSPAILNIGPPEFPGFIWAFVWISPIK